MPAPAMPAASGGISLAETRLAAMLSASPSFQTWAGVSTAPTALLRIHYDSLPPAAGDEYTLTELQTYRPYCKLYTNLRSGYVRERIAENTHDWKGKIVAELEQDISSTYAGYIPQAMRAFKNDIGAIIADLCSFSGGAGYLQIDRVEVVELVAYAEDVSFSIGVALNAVLRVEYQ
jgi:hypothetical protein